MKIELEGKTYELDVQKAIDDGYLTEDVIPFVLGGIYKEENDLHLPVRLAQVIHDDGLVETEKPRFALLSFIDGYSRPYSNLFYHTLHTREEILSYFKENNLKFSHSPIVK